MTGAPNGSSGATSKPQKYSRDWWLTSCVRYGFPASGALYGLILFGAPSTATSDVPYFVWLLLAALVGFTCTQFFAIKLVPKSLGGSDQTGFAPLIREGFKGFGVSLVFGATLGALTLFLNMFPLASFIGALSIASLLLLVPAIIAYCKDR